MIGNARPEPRALAGLGGAGAAISVFAVPGPAGWAGAGLALLMLAIADSDLRSLRIPDRLSLAAAALGLAQAAIVASSELGAALLDAGLRGAALAFGFLALRVGFRLWRGYDGLGLGDVKLAGVAGLWLEGRYMPLAVELAALTGLALALAVRWRRGPAALRRLRFPFGALLGPAIWICWLAQSEVWLFLG